jgi:hypothetical protein
MLDSRYWMLDARYRILQPRRKNKRLKIEKLKFTTSCNHEEKLKN